MTSIQIASAIMMMAMSLMGCSWLDFEEGTYCYCKVEADECDSLELEFEQNRVNEESQKEAEIPAL